jgi:glycosyltransferase involved in cell wall biosynthesis
MIIVVDDGSNDNTAELAMSKSFINFINRSLIKSTINDSQSGFCAYQRSVYN